MKNLRNILTFVGVFGVFGVVGSFVLHVVTHFFDSSSLPVSLYGLLHVLAIMAFFAFLVIPQRNGEKFGRSNSVAVQLYMLLFIMIIMYGLYVSWYTGFFDAGFAALVDGNYVIYNHGKIIRTINEQEYIVQTTWSLRRLSVGDLIFFYGVAGGALFSREESGSMRG